MARPIRVTVGSATTSGVIALDNYRTPFNVGIGCALSAGANLTYKVQYTYDDVQDPAFNASTATWFDHATLAAKTTSSDGNIVVPVTALRLNVAPWTSGSVTMTVIQAGMPGE
jgi:hypothetical protein